MIDGCSINNWLKVGNLDSILKNILYICWVIIKLLRFYGYMADFLPLRLINLYDATRPCNV